MSNLLEQFGLKVVEASKNAAAMTEFANIILPLNDPDDPEATAAFKQHYLNVLNFTPPDIAEDGFGEVVSMAVKAAALRASSAQAKLPLACIELYLSTLTEEELDEFFSTMYAFAEMSAEESDGISATWFQDMYFFLEYSEVAQNYMLGNVDLHEKFCELPLNPAFTLEDIHLVQEYRRAFFLYGLGEDSILMDCIIHPDRFLVVDEDDDDGDDESPLMSAIEEDNKLDPLSADYDVSSDEDDASTSVTVTCHWELDPKKFLESMKNQTNPWDDSEEDEDEA